MSLRLVRGILFWLSKIRLNHLDREVSIMYMTSKKDRNGVSHDGWADVGKANRGGFNKDADYQRKVKEVQEKSRSDYGRSSGSWWDTNEDIF